MKSLIAIALVLFSVSAHSQIYVIGSVSNATYSPQQITQKDSVTSYGASVGYQINPYFGIQAGVNNGGSYTFYKQTTKVMSEYAGGSFSFPLTRSVFGFIGAGANLSQTRNSKGSNSVLQPAFTTGFGYRATEDTDLLLSVSNVGGRFLGFTPSMDTTVLSTSIKYSFK